MTPSKYVSKRVRICDNGEYKVEEETFRINVLPKSTKRLGVMMVGWGGSNGSTLTAGVLAKQKGLTWRNKTGKHSVQFLGSLAEFGSVHIGYDKDGKPHSKLFKDLVDMTGVEDLVIGGWDVCGDNLYEAALKAGVLDNDLLKQLKSQLIDLKPLPSIYQCDFIASNQESSANNVLSGSKKDQLCRICEDIFQFKMTHNLDNIIILWTASTERFHQGGWKDHQELYQAIIDDDPEVSPSILFAFATAQCGLTFLNGSPQNTLCPAVIDKARHAGTFVGGEDFKTGQTKLKSALADWLVCSGIRPLSIVSYNHLGNNDGKNLDEAPQFRSKEVTKKNVIDDIVEENPQLFQGEHPDHAVVIKYVPAVGDSKRAMDEYYSELFLDGRHTLAIHNTCEDSLLAAPLMLDIVLFAELFARVRFSRDKVDEVPFSPVLSMLSFFFKAPVVNDGEPLVNAFFKQRYGLENFFRVLKGLPPLDHISLNARC